MMTIVSHVGKATNSGTMVVRKNKRKSMKEMFVDSLAIGIIAGVAVWTSNDPDTLLNAFKVFVGAFAVQFVIERGIKKEV